MRENGYTHNDFHTQNIGVVRTNTKYMTLFGNRIPLVGYRYQAIDYGMVLHKKYKMDSVSRPLILRFIIILLIPCVLFTTRFEELADG